MRRPYRKLSLDERRVLAQMLQAKATKTKIAETLGRDRSTIHREIKRNWWHDEEVPQADGYWHMTAQMMSDQRRSRLCKHERLIDLREEVIAKLKTGWSPEQIAGRLKIEPRAPYRICHETIYQYVYSDSGQSQELGRYLPERRKKRKPRYSRKARWTCHVFVPLLCCSKCYQRSGIKPRQVHQRKEQLQKERAPEYRLEQPCRPKAHRRSQSQPGLR